MEPSLFIQYMQTHFPSIVLSVSTKINGSENPLTYLHRTMLRVTSSLNGKWESISSSNSLVAADLVAMDSSIPLKTRRSISKASGDIPKMGMELQLNERQLTELLELRNSNRENAEDDLIDRLFADTEKVIAGIYERNEAMFLEGLSTGVTLVEDAENVGTGVRIDYGYPTANKFGTSVVWSSAATATPFDDLNRVIEKARTDGNIISVVMMDRTAFNNLAATKQAKELFAFSQGFTGTQTPTPSLTQVNTFASDRYGFTIQIVERTITYEKNGEETKVKPWADGFVLLTTAPVVGNLVYATLAELVSPVAGVAYQNVDRYILVSKFRTNRPSLAEFTTSQARVVPVITNPDKKYLLDSKTVQA